MNLQQAKIILEKINALQKSMLLDGGDVSSIEKDLMLSYIRQLYEIHAHLDNNAKKAPIQREIPVPKPKASLPPKPPKPEPVVQAPPPPPPPAPPPPPKPEPAVYTPPPPPPPAPEPAPAPPPPPPAPKAAPVAKASAGVEALFKKKKAKELSEKLSQQNIRDLTKALSINDKLLYANELFGRDMQKMNSVLSELNSFSSMEAAKSTLIRFAEEFDWTEDERLEVAGSFIKLVSRKYT